MAKVTYFDGYDENMGMHGSFYEGFHISGEPRELRQIFKSIARNAYKHESFSFPFLDFDGHANIPKLAKDSNALYVITVITDVSYKVMSHPYVKWWRVDN